MTLNSWKAIAIISLSVNTFALSLVYHKTKTLPVFDDKNGGDICTEIGNEFRANGTSKSCTALHEGFIHESFRHAELVRDLNKCQREKTI